MKEFVFFRDNQQVEKHYNETGTIAEESLTALKVVKAFGNESVATYKFDTHVDKFQTGISKNAFLFGLGLGFQETVLLFFTIVGFLIGAFFITEHIHNSNTHHDYDAGDVMSCTALNFAAGYIGHSFYNQAKIKKGLV